MKDKDVIGARISLGEILLFPVWLTEPTIPLSGELSDFKGLNTKKAPTTTKIKKPRTIPDKTLLSTN